VQWLNNGDDKNYKPITMKTYLIFEREREYARVHGDHPICTVVAESKEEAERIASRRTVTGAWAVENE